MGDQYILTVSFLVLLIGTYESKHDLAQNHVIKMSERCWTVSVSPVSITSSLLALVVNLDHSFAFRYVLSVLCKKKSAPPMPTHSRHTVSLVSISLAHINTALPPVLSLCCLSSPLTRPPPLAFLFFFVQQ